MPSADTRFLVRFPHQVTAHGTAGVGFVVGQQHILTCAHVVNVALGRDERSQESPGAEDEVHLRFPLAGDATRSARVQRWVPPPTDGTRGGDIAGLVIVGAEGLPAGVAPAQLSPGAAPGCHVTLFGYPSRAGRPEGIWALGRVRGEVGGGLMQIDAEAQGAWRAQPGFSGTPVIDVTTGDVIGMFKVAGIRNDERPDSYAIPTSQLCAAWEHVLAVLPANPYQGLAAFTAAEADLFLGRDAETGLLVDAVARSPLVLVVGPSGVGKSSLVQAGLIDTLAEAGWASQVCRPGEHPDDPFRALAAALCRAEGAAADIERQRARAGEIRAGGLATLAADLRLASGRRTLLVVDQLEELFTLVEDRAVAAEFLGRLLELPQTLQLPETLRAEHPVAVVATLRADFYHRLLAHPDAAPRLVGREVKLSPLGPDALRDVIATPAHLRGVHYAPRLVERIVADASTSEGALPLLEFALTELWHHQRGGEIGHEAYDETGGVVGSIDRHAELAVKKMLDAGISERDIERTLIALISSSGREDLPATRRSCLADELDDTQRRVAEALTRARLLTATRRHEQACYELAHEALIGSWQRLHQAAEADGEFLRWRTRLEQWDEEQHGLLPDAWVAEGTRWCTQRDDISPRLADLVRRSQDELQRRIHELQTTRDEARSARDEARSAARRAEALRLAAQAQMELIQAAGGTAALALAAESLNLEHTFAGDSVARAALRLAARPVSSLTHDGGVNAVVFSPDGAWVATASDDHTARVFDAATGTERTRLTHDREVYGVVFSPDGAWVATASDDHTARVSAVRAEELRAVVVVHLPRELTDAEWRRYGGRPVEL